MKENLLSVTKKARVITAGDSLAKTAVVVLHGYGQLSARFLEKMITIPEVYWVAPEALSRFYVEGFSGNVGASWMTKEMREEDISDNLNYLREVFENFIIDKGFEKVVLLGFSQGGATAIRFAHAFPEQLQALIVWGSDFPKELVSDFREMTKGVQKYFVLGNQDPFFTSETQGILRKEMEALDFKNVMFEGKHKIEKEVLGKILVSIRNGDL
ncbi:alpha/beta hydrolase [Flavobacterium sp.]|uniref:alpha/beta hydrolase n=1 Tax=Flavobacterium sp. TaxID=239 RepID=UPI003D144BE0